MTFAPAAWAIDGARIESALARTASFAESGGAEGTISVSDLQVLPLAVAGQGLRITGGGALLLNRYQSPINQSYTVLNAGEEVLDVADMPPASTSAKSYLVCITVGDPEFEQVGHPWMLSSDPPAGEEETFQYVRPFVIETGVTGATRSFAELGLPFPALALARLDVPANTTTITSDMIVDLRKIARPRNSEEIFTAGGSPDDWLNGGGVANNYEPWPDTATFAVDIPEWATVARVQGFVESAKHVSAGGAKLRIALEGAGASFETNINEDAPSAGIGRKGYSVGGTIQVPEAVRGTSQTLKLEASPNGEPSFGFLRTDDKTGALVRIRFEEEIV